MENTQFQLIYKSGTTYNLPVWLDNTIDDMGVMVGFDGDISIEAHLCDFTYTSTGRTLTIINTADTTALRSIVQANFTIDWGDGHKDDSSLSLSGTTYDCMNPTSSQLLVSANHTYSSDGTYVVSISLLSPWSSQIVKKTIVLPIPPSVYTPINVLGSFNTIPVPSIINAHVTGQTLDTTKVEIENYVNELSTGATISFSAFGKSRVSELQLYGGGYSGLTITSGYTAYTIDNLTYFDYPDGLTHITGNTSNFYFESVIDKMITRNEHFIGFIDEPIIYSDIFVKRGQQSVLENTLRLSEIDNTGLLQIYGNGYFNIQKQ